MNTPKPTKKIDPAAMSQRELDEYLDALTDAGKDDTPEFHHAYAVWEKNQ